MALHAFENFPDIPVPAFMRSGAWEEPGSPNDACASAELVLGTSVLHVWIDHRDLRERELPGSPRFLASVHDTRTPDEDWTEVYRGEDEHQLEAALARVIAALRPHPR